MGGVIVLDFEAESRHNFNVLSQMFNPNYCVDSEDRQIIDNYSKGIIYLLLCLGVPKRQLQIVLQNAFNYTISKEIKHIFTDLKKEYRQNKECVICGSKENLQIHHIKPIGRNPHLKYNPVNWIVVCGSCHKELHDVLGV